MKYNINLLGKKKPSLADRVVHFLLNYLRYILVITQLVVLGVFFYRFTVDESIVDLRESIEQKRAIIQVVQPLLAEANKINTQAQDSKKILNTQGNFLASFRYVLSLFPQNLVLRKLTISQDKIMLNGIALTPKDLQLFYRKLKKDNRFSRIDLSNIEKKEGVFTFRLELVSFKN
ncbi:PilN domain-containing protein [Candidatus Roizmanbacteria bacterium]|nr:PilN domain-containing protein [Candidatus Roizmanbacteria bacterium]